MNVLQMSISAGVLILIVAVIRAIGINRLPKTMFIAFWGIALCRLLLPLSIPSKFGINNVINIISKVFALRAGAANEYRGTGDLIYQSTVRMEAMYKPLLLQPMVIFWVAGMVLLALFFAVSFYKCYMDIRTALPVKGNSLIDKWLSEQKLKRTIKILISDQISTPLTYGMIKPKIILPKMMDYGNEQQLRYILAHELIHIKRFDTLWKIVMIIALCCHWFNPMVWVLYVLMNRDLEIACDEKVIRLCGEGTKTAYALSLIEMAEGRTKFTPLYSSFSKNATKERIVSIMKFKKTSLFSLVLALMLVAGATTVFAGGSVNTTFRLHGEIQSESGSFNFDIDEKGIVTVKDADGKVVSTTTVGKDGMVTLTDGYGKVIQTLHLYAPIYKPANGGFFRIYQTPAPSGISESDLKKVIGADFGMLPKYTTEISGKGTVTVKDSEGKVIGKGTADNNGTVVLADNKGVKIGEAIVSNGKVIKLAISINVS